MTGLADLHERLLNDMPNICAVNHDSLGVTIEGLEPGEDGSSPS